MHNSELQFHNEILWYKEVVPAYEALAARFELSVAHLWPKFYASVDGELAAIVMQDLSREGFGLAQPATTLSLEHAQIAMRKIGLLHALGYALQSHDKLKGQKIIQTLKVFFLIIFCDFWCL
jgi:Ecdysteroid kinase-like family